MDIKYILKNFNKDNNGLPEVRGAAIFKPGISGSSETSVRRLEKSL